jgi:chaperone modulatory protein CbpM
MKRRTVTGILLDEQVCYSLKEVCQVCESQQEWVIELVEEGILQPIGEQRRKWQFPGSNVHTAMKARRLQRDLGLNLPGVALALELLEEIEALRSKLGMLEVHGEPATSTRRHE